ncbi:putative quinol monooxygenase [Liquorilactobacillus satsumensis]|uniref:ABM domain-containing protein n=1 Tax=Liquorilactobacillus satsumensis DSM 16230 = JCM 12392 TaxID=1423801 RepID=A0A0R1V6H5_9LACO|nr:putative quinol monooxygenase [Liquorilactobacillus satsumensis]KRL98984.1 hypothetical protein FD50_GL000250 [Liquorilactobacillus satsumensis DSM 16230 = JCM 12392]MCC7666945.1 antibiotic biosynthesis monooxygenase [Liquorilactobacillus satsumensis]MCP9312241.1 antibiotic biosynthesis monooxygenase [Liquorilactobacillus satsumensis]MCP9328745.1 antibiotic biosynthesis monooxygenase [Liquorilactobacillus satsumensis]MCP9357227.1 antibiotic biosynthesis monooxygenase [Liquorilactobacillus s
MKIINVALQVDPAKQADYEAFINELVVNSAKEPGNLSYGHFKKLNCTAEYEIIEHWKDAAAVEEHNATPHFQKFLAHVNDYLIHEPEIIRMTV